MIFLYQRVKVKTFRIGAVLIRYKVLTVFGHSKRDLKSSALKLLAIKGKNGQRCFVPTLKSNVGSVGLLSLAVHGSGLVFVDHDLSDLAELTKIVRVHQQVLAGHLLGEAYYVDQV